MENDNTLAIESMTIRELFKELNISERKLMANKKQLQAAQMAYGKGHQELAEIVRSEKLDMACEKWLSAEKDAITAWTKEYEDAMAHFNQVGREIDARRMEIDQEKLRQGIT